MNHSSSQQLTKMPKAPLTPEQMLRKKECQERRTERRRLLREIEFAQKVEDFHEAAILASRLADKKRKEQADRNARMQEKKPTDEEINQSMVDQMKLGFVLFDRKNKTSYEWSVRDNKIQVVRNFSLDEVRKIEERDFVQSPPDINWESTKWT